MPLPPWLDVRPRDFAEAAQTGLTLGLRRRQLNQDAFQAGQRIALGAAELNQRHQSELNDMAIASQRLQQEKEAAAMKAETDQQVKEQDFRTQQARDNVTNAYRMAQIRLGEKRLEDAAKDKVANIADIQGYWNAVHSGMAPEAAAAKFPRAISSGMGTAITRSDNVSSAGRMSDMDRIRYQHALSAVNSGNRDLTEAQTTPGADTSAIQNNISSAKKAIEEIESRYQGGGNQKKSLDDAIGAALSKLLGPDTEQ